MTTTPDTCTEHVGSDLWSRPVCGKPFRTDDQKNARLCGVHLAAKRRREKSAAAWEEKYAADRAARETAEDLAARILDAVGGGDGHTAVADRHGNVTISPETARALLDRLGVREDTMTGVSAR